MKLLSVNVGTPRTVQHRGTAITTAIFKEPVEGRVAVGPEGLAGDSQAARDVHGGIDKAVYAYGFGSYAHWARELGRDDLAFGQFGENLTVDDCDDGQVHIGDTFRVGTAVLQVTQPRAPCNKLEMKMGVDGFIARFLDSGRVGFYLRVLEQGELGAGDPVERLSVGDGRMTVREISFLRYRRRDDLDGARRAAALEALSPGWRQAFQRRVTVAG